MIDADAGIELARRSQAEASDGDVDAAESKVLLHLANFHQYAVDVLLEFADALFSILCLQKVIHLTTWQYSFLQCYRPRSAPSIWRVRIKTARFAFIPLIIFRLSILPC